MAMVRIDWSDEYKLGLPAIDADHQDLLAICNEFLESAQTDCPVSQLAVVLDRMVARTRAHFVAEERLLDRHGYPGLAAHKAEHERLLIQADTLRSRFAEEHEQEGLHQLTLDTADFLQLWLLDHIRTNDRPYRPFLMSLA
jgi:hemerythrin